VSERDEKIMQMGHLEVEYEQLAGERDRLARRVAELEAARDDPEKIARMFHEAYERHAPEHGYETRRESAVPWEAVPENNRALMVAVAAEVGAALAGDGGGA
jgi:hypothetical protein